jgi:hypothetical protein
MRWSNDLRVRLGMVAVLQLAWLAGCHNEVEPMGPAYSFAWARPDCGPADGPAVRIVLANVEPPDSLVDPVPHLAFYLYTGVDNVNGRAFSLRPDEHEGSAQYCRAAGECSMATDGRIRFTDVVAGSHLSGTYDSTLPSGERQSGRFRATWRDRQVFCI